MKKFCLTVLFLFVFSTVAFASPLMDYSSGKVAIDLNWRPSSSLDFSRSLSGNIDGANGSYDLALTVGLGNKLAFQWANQTVKSKDAPGLVSTGDTFYGYSKATANQFNILYQVEKNFAVFAGYTQAKNEITSTAGTLVGVASGKNISGWQAGLVGSFPMGNNLTGYGSVGFGDKIVSFEIGASYALAANTELNVFYKSTEYKDLEFNLFPGAKYDLKADGLGVGVTFKF